MADEEIKAQIERAVDAFADAAQGGDVSRAFRQLEQLEQLKDSDPEKLIRQLVLYEASTTSQPQGGALLVILDFLHLPKPAIVSALAPVMDSSNRRIQYAIQNKFDHVEDVDGEQSPDFSYYRQYLSQLKRQGEDPPVAFTSYLYGRYPGEALSAYASAWEMPREEHRRIVWSKHILDTAIWKREHGFLAKDQVPNEALLELRELAQRDQWWARLYAASIAKKHPELVPPEVAERLARDEHELVRTVMSEETKRAPRLAPPEDPEEAVREEKGEVRETDVQEEAYESPEPRGR